MMTKEIRTISKTAGVLSPNETHYIVAQNGTFLALKVDWVDAVIPIKLQYQLPEATLKIPLPGNEVFLPVLRFFHAVYKLHNAEAVVLLHFNMAEKKWAISIPKQEVSMASAQYDMTDRLPGYRCVGTMHSHGSMAAGHSTVDRHDEEVFDGLHITIGTIQKFPEFDMDAQLVVHGHQFKVRTEEFPTIVLQEPPGSVPSTRKTGFWGEVWRPEYEIFDRRRFFALTKVTKDQFGEPVPPEWLVKVKAKPLYQWQPSKLASTPLVVILKGSDKGIDKAGLTLFFRVNGVPLLLVFDATNALIRGETVSVQFPEKTDSNLIHRELERLGVAILPEPEKR